MNRSYSFVIPVYNRPDEIGELLESMTALRGDIPFEVVIVEDGSSISCKDVVSAYLGKLAISYHYKPNSGPGDSRNFGMGVAEGNYFIILDSDCLLPPTYLQTVDRYLSAAYVDCYGGADDAHQDFTDLQKAINYAMTSFWTTGGLRGSKRSKKFEPRSFNMGLSKKAFQATQGFARIHPGEDPDLSIRLVAQGFQTAFVPNAFVFHKRRISWSKFYTQVRKFGLVRPILIQWHPGTDRLTYWFPSFFIGFVWLSLFLAVGWRPEALFPLLTYLFIVFVDASRRTASLKIGILAIRAVFTQFIGYGLAYIQSTFLIRVLRRDPEKQFPQLFFK